MRNTRLSSEYIEAIKADPVLLAKIAKHIGRSTKTLERWLYNNNRALSSPAVQEQLRKHLQLSKDLVLIYEDAAAPVTN